MQARPFFFACRAHRCRGNGAWRSDSVWPTGTQYNARITFARFCTFVLLPFPNSIIFAKRGESTNEYKRSTNTLGKRHPRRYKRIQTEYTRVQTSTDELHKPEVNHIPGGTDEYKRIYPVPTVNWKQIGQSVSNYGRR